MTTLLALNPRARTQDLGTTVAPDCAICKYSRVREIARSGPRESHLRSPSRFLAPFLILHTTQLYTYCVRTYIFSCIRKNKSKTREKSKQRERMKDDLQFYFYIRFCDVLKLSQYPCLIVNYLLLRVM